MVNQMALVDLDLANNEQAAVTWLIIGNKMFNLPLAMLGPFRMGWHTGADAMGNLCYSTPWGFAGGNSWLHQKRGGLVPFEWRSQSGEIAHAE